MSDDLGAQDAHALRLSMAADDQRPTYHFLSPANWINDPHGLIEWKGQFHLFYQYNPMGPYHGSIHWGHAVSDDLVTWRDLPVALTPGPETYDQEGCWTGFMVVDEGQPIIFYTAVQPQTIAAAVGDDDLVCWTKLDENPLIDGPPTDIRPYAGGHFRDPFIWKTSDGWEMIVVSKIESEGGQVLLYGSSDLKDWHYKGIFLAGDARQREPFWQGTMWECPNLLQFSDGQVLIVSVQATPSEHLYTVYFSGDRVGDGYEPRSSGMLVYGSSFYAPQVVRLADGRLLMFGWLHEERSAEACLEAGWNGAHSLPLVVDMRSDGAVAVNPAVELQKLRGDHWQESEFVLAGDTEYPLPHIRGKALEIEARFLPDEDAEFGLRLFCSPDGAEETRIVYDRRSGQILVERERASLDQRAAIQPAVMPVRLGDDEPLNMRLFVDHSTIEIFINERLSLACRVYPSLDESDGVGLFSRRGETAVSNLNIWKMKGIWPGGRRE